MRIIFFLFVVSNLLFSQNINEKILFASARGQLDSLNKFLLSDSVDINYKYQNGYTSLDYAIERDHKQIFKRWIEYYYSTIKSPNKSEEISAKLVLAILNSNLKNVNKILALGAKPNYQNNSGYFPLSIAVRWGEYEIVKQLINYGAKVNKVTKNRYNTTPLMELTRNGNIKIGELLLANGADINFVDVNNDPAINWATYFGQVELVKLFLKNGAKSNIIGKESGDDALAIAKRMKHLEIEKILEKYKK